jgi:hypothetical protein
MHCSDLTYGVMPVVILLALFVLSCCHSPLPEVPVTCRSSRASSRRSCSRTAIGRTC